jgi:DNA-binding IclR family transcriptional regulator
MRSGTGTQSVDRAASLLATILDSATPLTFTDLQRQTGLAKSTLSRLLSSMEFHDLVRRADDGVLRPGPVLTRYAHSTRPYDELISIAQPHLQAVSDVTGETINLAIMAGDEVEQISQVDATFLMGNVNWVGIRVPLHCSALGKVFLAHGASLPEGRLARRTPETISNRTQLAAELETVRQRGWAVADSELEPGLVALAAPILASDGSVVAALSASGPSVRIGPERFESLGALLVHESAKVSRELGYTSEQRRKAGAA